VEQRPFNGEVLTHRPWSEADPASFVLSVPLLDQRVQFGEGIDLRDGYQVIAAEPANLPLHPALLVGLEVVVANLVRGDAAQHAECMDVALQERFLPAGGENAVYRLARVAQPHREQVAGDQLAGQAYLHVPEVDLRLRPRPVGLRNERVHRSAARGPPQP
jgi:hypothetical protein